MTHIRNLTTGAVSYVPARGLTVAGQVVSRTTSAAALAALGYEWWAPPEPPEPTLDEQRAGALARVRQATGAHILATYPDWYQRDCALGIYPEAAQTACREGIAACIEASNAAEDAVAAAVDSAGIAAAEAALALPEIAR